MDSRKVQIEVDKASVKTAKAAIDDLTKSIRNLFK
jgi:polyisoprenoid-binding protein YceI